MKTIALAWLAPALVLAHSSAFAKLSPLDPQFIKYPSLGPAPSDDAKEKAGLSDFDSTWNLDLVKKAYDQANPRFDLSEIETYSIPSAMKIQTENGPYAGSEILYDVFGSDSTEHRKRGRNFLQTTCRVFHRNWEQESLLFRYPQAMISKLPQAPKTDFVLSGNWVPNLEIGIVGLEPAYEVMSGQSFVAEGYRIQIPRNNSGIYDDFKAPLSITYRMTKNGNLIGKFQDPQGQELGMKVCWAARRVFCYLRGSISVQKSLYDPSDREWKNMSRVEIGANEADAREKIRDYIQGNEQYVGKTRVKSIQCSTDLSKIQFEYNDENLADPSLSKLRKATLVVDPVSP